jgi:hypothetical protein
MSEYESGTRVRLTKTPRPDEPLVPNQGGTVVELNLDHIEAPDGLKVILTAVVESEGVIPVKWDGAPLSTDGADYYLMYPNEFEIVS